MKRSRHKEKWLLRYERATTEGTNEEVRKLEFGLLIREARETAGLFQKQAAHAAKLSRTEWNLIENGYSLPHPSNIRGIAKAINTSPSKLFKRAGYAVPSKFMVYGKREACRDLHIALQESMSAAEFLLSMGYVWQRYIQEQAEQRIPIAEDQIYITAFALIIDHFTDLQKLQLANALLQESSILKVKRFKYDPQRFLDALDVTLADLRNQARQNSTS